MKILGIDYGDKKIGLALGDSTVQLAVPLEVISNRGIQTIDVLCKMVRNEDFELIVVGVPLTTGDHHSAEQLEKTRAFIKILSSAVLVPVIEEDESYTTAESLRLQKEEGAQAPEDALAAMLIVQSYLNQII
ncbi:Holliday junction resolvase RuvX [Candidatus Uhrbacteria bacterium]|nr:Holliday junction resolvase RuvX [Candidatus Uhrbacteria bacterium]